MPIEPGNIHRSEYHDDYVLITALGSKADPSDIDMCRIQLLDNPAPIDGFIDEINPAAETLSFTELIKYKKLIDGSSMIHAVIDNKKEYPVGSIVLVDPAAEEINALRDMKDIEELKSMSVGIALISAYSYIPEIIFGYFYDVETETWMTQETLRLRKDKAIRIDSFTGTVMFTTLPIELKKHVPDLDEDGKVISKEEEEQMKIIAPPGRNVRV